MSVINVFFTSVLRNILLMGVLVILGNMFNIPSIIVLPTLFVWTIYLTLSSRSSSWELPQLGVYVVKSSLWVFLLVLLMRSLPNSFEDAKFIYNVALIISSIFLGISLVKRITTKPNEKPTVKRWLFLQYCIFSLTVIVVYSHYISIVN